MGSEEYIFLQGTADIQNVMLEEMVESDTVSMFRRHLDAKFNRHGTDRCRLTVSLQMELMLMAGKVGMDIVGRSISLSAIQL